MLVVGSTLGVAAVGLEGCETVNQTYASIMGTETAPGEQALYDAALASGSPADIGAFLEAYPQSEQVVPLLTAAPADTLMQVDLEALRLVPAGSLAALPPFASSLIMARLQGPPEAAPAPTPASAPVETMPPRNEDDDY
jgi:hypothetical protein